MAHATANTSTQTGLLEALVHFAANAKARYAQYRVFRTTLSEMQDLTDRELADLGLSRSMIRRKAYEVAYG